MLKNKLIRFIGLASLMAAVAVAPTFTASAADKKDEKKEEKKTKGVPYHGTVGAVDKVAKTVTIKTKEKSRTYQVTSDTKITKAGKPATLDDATVGEEAAAYGHEEGGKHIAQSIRFGAKPETKVVPKKKSDEKK